MALVSKSEVLESKSRAGLFWACSSNERSGGSTTSCSPILLSFCFEAWVLDIVFGLSWRLRTRADQGCQAGS